MEKKKAKISMESILYWLEVWLMYPGSLHWRKLFPFPAGINGFLVRDGTWCLLAFLAGILPWFELGQVLRAHPVTICVELENK